MPASDVSLFDWLWPRPHRVFSGHWKEYHHSNIKTQQARVPCDCISQPFTHTHTQTAHSLSPCPSTTSNWDNREISAKVSLRSLVKQEGHTKIRHHMLILAKPYKVKVWHSDGSYAGWGSYAGTLKTSRGGCNSWKSHEERRRCCLSVPTVVFYHVGQLDDELPLLILLTQLKRLFLQRGGKIIRFYIHMTYNCVSIPFHSPNISLKY